MPYGDARICRAPTTTFTTPPPCAEALTRPTDACDYNLSEKDRFFFRYSGMKALLDNSTSINQFYQGGNADSDSYNQNMHLTHMHMFGADQDERDCAWRTIARTSLPAHKSMDKDWNNFYGLKNGNLGDPITRGLVEFSGFDPIHNVGDPDWVAFIIGNTIALTDNFTWVKGQPQHEVRRQP